MPNAVAPRAQRVVVGACLRGNSLEQSVVRYEPLGVTLRDRVRRPATVAKDLKEPGLEALPFLVPRECSIQSNEGFLDHVLCIVRLYEHRAREAQTSRVVRLNDLGECTDIAKLRATYRFGVETGGLSRVWQR
jgi:hypothetical protein